MTVTALATLLSAYSVGVIIGVFTTNTFQQAPTFWGGWCMVGGIVTLATTRPIIVSSKGAGGRKFKNE
jgi:uncharacterized membrane protein YoaK (UPF0700 family)